MDTTEQTDIGKLLRDARRAKRMTGVQLALAAGCTQSAISQFEGGKETALRRETVEKIAEILGIELPRQQEGGAVVVAAPPPARTPVAAFCPNGECPSNVPYVVGGELLLFPRKQPDPAAVYCPWCGEVLEHACPQCEEPATQTAFCPSCGTKRVEPPADIARPSEWAAQRRREISELDALV